jgi:hypothetical protein
MNTEIPQLSLNSLSYRPDLQSSFFELDFDDFYSSSPLELSLSLMPQPQSDNLAFPCGEGMNVIQNKDEECRFEQKSLSKVPELTLALLPTACNSDEVEEEQEVKQAPL